MFGGHVLKGWSKTQSLIVFSSGEFELYATLRASAEALGTMAMMKDLGCQVGGEIWSDGSAALGISHRIGLGKTRHIDTGLLWIQQTAAEQRLTFPNVLGKNNPADLFAKYLDQVTSENHTATMKYEFTTGRAREVPKLHCIWRLVGEHLMNSNQKEWEGLRLIVDWYGNRGVSKNPSATRNVLGRLCTRQSKKCESRESNGDGRHVTIDGLRTAGLPGKQLAGTGVQRFERRPVCQPWGSILIFQHKIAVSWAFGLRHGVAMHPRGRHLREGIILLCT